MRLPARHPADGSLALAYLRALVRGHDVDREAVWFVVPGPPVAKGRPRRGERGNIYTPEATRAAEDALAMFWRAAARGTTLPSTVAVAAVFYVPTARASDADNMLKLLLDAGNLAEVWVDDSFVTATAAGLELDREHPRTVVAYCPTESTMTRAAKRCRACDSVLTRVSMGVCPCGTNNRRRA